MKKNTLRFLTVLTLALGAALAVAQEERPPQPRGSPQPPQPPNRERERGPGPPPREGQRGERREGARPPDGERRYDGPRDSRGERRPEGDRRPDNAWNFHLPPPAPPKPTRYLGVVTAPIPPALAAQLGLAEGFGMVVSDVLPDSPAAQAGVQKWDVLTKFNDQRIISAEQFATLVRAEAKDAGATLTLIRKAQEQKVPVKVGEKMMAERRGFPLPGDWQREMEKWKGPATDATRRLQEKMREYQERMKEFQERIKDWQKNPTGDAPQAPPPPEFGALPHLPPVPPMDILREAKPGGAAQIRVEQPQGGVVYNTGRARVSIKDGDGEIEISMKDGRRVLVAKNKDGATIFDGPIETEEQRAALPGELREKIKRIDVRASAATFDPVPFVPAEIERNVQ